MSVGRGRVCFLSLALLLLAGCGAGNVAYREARKAELRKDWDTALVNYQKALLLEPENAKYVIHEKLVRTQASEFHLKQGRHLMDEGRPEEAAGELQKAASIDPTNEAAAQQLSRVLAAQAEAKKARESALKQALKASEEATPGGVVKLKTLSQEPIGRIHFTGDAKQVYETLAKLAGLNVAFSPDFHPAGQNPLDLSNIKIEDALRIVALQTKTFWRPVTPNTIVVFVDNPNNRRDFDQKVLKTVYLTNPLPNAERTAIVTALKQVLHLQYVIDNPDSNAIIIQASPDEVAAAENLIHDLDRGKAEIMIEVSVIEADRDRVRDLGITPATITSSGTPTPGVQGAAVYAPSVTTTTSGSSATTTPTGFHLSTSDYGLVIPSAVASAVLSDTRTHILQNPLVRTTDGQKSTLKIGSSIPYATGSFLPSLGGTTTTTTGGFGLLASTQFQFKDVGVNMELTPHLLPDGEVAIHASIEISSLGTPLSIGGLSEPTFGQRKIEHDIRLKEGEVSVLGGLIQTNLTRVRSGTPFLGEIPVLGNLFSTLHTERNETEVLVMLSPHIVRLPEPPLGASSNVSVSSSAAAGPEAGPAFTLEPTPAQVPGPPVPPQPPQ